MQSARQAPGARYRPTGGPGHITLKPQDGDSSLLRNRAKDQQAKHHYDDDVMNIIKQDRPIDNMKIIIPKPHDNFVQLEEGLNLMWNTPLIGLSIDYDTSLTITLHQLFSSWIFKSQVGRSYLQGTAETGWFPSPPT